MGVSGDDRGTLDGNPGGMHPATRTQSRVPANRGQRELRAEVMPQYHFIVCASGSFGTVLARRLAENADVNVLLLEVEGPETPWLPASLWASADGAFELIGESHLRLA
jgi:hypothetical protein